MVDLREDILEEEIEQILPDKEFRVYKLFFSGLEDKIQRKLDDRA